MDLKTSGSRWPRRNTSGMNVVQTSGDSANCGELAKTEESKSRGRWVASKRSVEGSLRTLWNSLTKEDVSLLNSDSNQLSEMKWPFVQKSERSHWKTEISLPGVWNNDLQVANVFVWPVNELDRSCKVNSSNSCDGFRCEGSVLLPASLRKISRVGDASSTVMVARETRISLHKCIHRSLSPAAWLI